MSQPKPKPVECPDCGGTCDPECGRHPLGCLWNAVSVGYWGIKEKCKLAHPDIAKLKAQLMLDGLQTLRYVRS